MAGVQPNGVNGHPATGKKASYIYPHLKWLTSLQPTMEEGKYPGLRPGHIDYEDGMKIERDVAVTLRDGTKIYVDIFRHEDAGDAKLPIILTWSPYGKHGVKSFALSPNLFKGSDVPLGSVSKHAAWEGPDPVHWTKKGYAVINGDARGSWGSEGDCEILGAQEAQDGYDVIEWAASLPWSNGNVGLAGVSYLAIVQWRISALNPPHLRCINPWEGFSDFYREYAFHGGIPETNFVQFMEWSCRCGPSRVEDWLLLHKEHPMLDDYSASKGPADWAACKVPAYVVADWGDQGLHTRGTLNAFTKLGSSQKWLEVHGRKKWAYYYQPSSLKRQEAFYQKFLKNEASEVDSWPPVQLEIRDHNWEGIIRAEQEWPLKRQRNVIKYLNSATGKLQDKVPTELAVASYESQIQDNNIRFDYTFNHGTELTGSMRLRLWVSTDQADDMDMFVQIDKTDPEGNVIPFVCCSMLDEGPAALGWLRVSHRELDLSQSTVDRPWLQHKRRLLLREGEIVPVDIEIWPSSQKFSAGQRIRVTIQGNDIWRYDLRQVQLHEDSVNKGKHFIYSGPLHESYLIMPVIETEGNVGVPAPSGKGQW